MRPTSTSRAISFSSPPEEDTGNTSINQVLAVLALIRHSLSDLTPTPLKLSVEWIGIRVAQHPTIALAASTDTEFQKALGALYSTINAGTFDDIERILEDAIERFALVQLAAFRANRCLAEVSDA